ncbi:hypothetical protein [Chitinophaga sancti]|uniref:hypothetical protein n=1 Tax=Chitinophaga sancti TaxID=1004 RepID=UPI003F79DE5E
MIRYSLITFIVLFAGFNIYLRVKKQEYSTYQYQYQLNVIEGQKYIFGKRAPESVLLGTSLSALMPTDSLNGLYKLAMPGLSTADGRNIVMKRNSYPHRIFIEINFFNKPADEAYTSLFSSSVNNKIKEVLPALKEENQPVSILLSKFKKDHQQPGNNQVVPVNDTVPANIFMNLLAGSRRQYTDPIDTMALEKALDELTGFVEEVTAKGSHVCFFEMPVDQSLENLPKTVLVRNMIQQRFQGKQNTWFIHLPQGNFRTKDGIHLTESNAWDYTSYFKEEVDRLALAGF